MKSVKELFSRSKAQQPMGAPQRTPAPTPALEVYIFSKLPSEVIHYITNPLSPESIACFSLCYRWMYLPIGSLHVKLLS
jgi:hypothetical protein